MKIVFLFWYYQSVNWDNFIICLQFYSEYDSYSSVAFFTYFLLIYSMMDIIHFIDS